MNATVTYYSRTWGCCAVRLNLRQNKTETISNRILAKQALKKCDVCHCHTWKPYNNLVEDMRDGRCRKRYEEETLQIHNEQNNWIVSGQCIYKFIYL